MRAFMHRSFGISALFLLAVFALPAIARADSDEVKQIDGAVVRIKVVGEKTFIAVRSGTLVVKYDDGTELTTLEAGTAIMVSPLEEGAPTIGSVKIRKVKLGRKFEVSASRLSRRRVEVYVNGKTRVLTAGQTVKIRFGKTKYLINVERKRGIFIVTVTRVSRDEISFTN